MADNKDNPHIWTRDLDLEHDRADDVVDEPTRTAAPIGPLDEPTDATTDFISGQSRLRLNPKRPTKGPRLRDEHGAGSEARREIAPAVQ